MENVGDLICAVCGSSRVWLDYDGGEVVCVSCGAVLPEYGAEVMDCSSWEVGYDSDGLKQIRTRLRGTMVGWGMYGPGMLDGKGRRLSSDAFERGMRFVRFASHNLAGSCVVQVVRLVEGTIARLHIPKAVGVRAVEIYTKAHAVGIRRPLRRISAAAVYIACRESQIPISMKQIVHPDDRRLVWRMHNKIRFGLDLKPPSSDASRMVHRIVTAAKLPPSVERRAIALLMDLREADRKMKGTVIMMAAAAVYTSAREGDINTSLKQVASSAHVNANSLAEYCKLIASARRDLQTNRRFTS